MYRLPSEFRRTPEERTDQRLSWNRPDRAFFAAGACHILAKAFVGRYPECDYWLAGIRDTPDVVVGHVVATNGDLVFDFNGFTPMREFVDVLEADYATRISGWTCVLYPLEGDFRDVCEREHHRHPEDFAFLPWDRASAYIDQFEPPR